jgi:hypothetical protein
MRSITMGLATATALLATGLAGAAAWAGEDSPMAAREQIDRSFTLAPGALVRVSSIAGPVTVETGGGSRAELHILREAASQRELACTRTEIDNRNGGLSVRQVRKEEQGCRNLHSRQTVRLILPRNIDLTLDSIAGKVDVGAVEGAVRLSSIAGRTSLQGARSAEVSSVAGRLTLAVGPIGPRGVKVSSVAGPVDLVFRPGTSADVSASSVVGQVTSASPAIQVRREQRRYSARIGSGGPLVSLSSIVGPVRLSIS